MPPFVHVLGPLLAGVLGLFLGGAINWAVQSLAWDYRPLSPWSPPHPHAPPRRWLDKAPVWGWLSLRREQALHGRWFWLRPLVIEVGFALFAAWLWRWELSGGLYSPLAPVPDAGVLAASCLAHLVLIALLTAATFIDFDEKTIPDEITLPGVYCGLLFAALCPGSALLPSSFNDGRGQIAAEPLLVTGQPLAAWSPEWSGPRGLALGLAILAGWALALLPATATLRRGPAAAVRYYLASLPRRRTQFGTLYLGRAWRFYSAVYAVLALLTAVVWSVGGSRWPVLLSGICGLGFGMGLIWSMRVVGWLGLRVEAMGFGDATLLAAIGAFFGWQATLVVFLLSPFAAVFIALGQWLFTGRKDIAFGPYLSLSAVIVLTNWPWLWEEHLRDRLESAGAILPLAGLACLCLMLGLLMLWRNIKERWLLPPEN